MKNHILIYLTLVLVTLFFQMFLVAYCCGKTPELRNIWIMSSILPSFLLAGFSFPIFMEKFKHKEFYATYDEIVKLKEDSIKLNQILQDKIKKLGELEANKLFDEPTSANPKIKGISPDNPFKNKSK